MLSRTLLLTALILLVPTATAAAQLRQPNGVPVPIFRNVGEPQISHYFAGLGEPIDMAQDARSGPGTFYPTAGSRVTFGQKQTGQPLALAWYDPAGAAPAAADLHVLLPATSAPGDSAGLDAIRNSPQWDGGAIAFAVIGVQTMYSILGHNTFCTPPVCSPGAPWLRSLVYRSALAPATVSYLAFEDGNVSATGNSSDLDFNDAIYRLTTGVPENCADGSDNDGDGRVDAADRGCHDAGAYAPSDPDETDPPAPAVTLDVDGGTFAATVTEPGTGFGRCEITIDADRDGTPETALATDFRDGRCTATPPAGLAPGDYAVRVAYSESFAGAPAATATGVYRVAAPLQQSAPQPEVPPLRCAGRAIDLIDVGVRGGKVRLFGLTLPAYAGQRVTLSASSGRLKASAAVRSDGSFEALVARPSTAVAKTIRYSAAIANHRSPALKLTRRFVVSGQQGTRVSLRLTGRYPKGTKLEISRQVTCDKRTIVKRQTLRSGGRLTLTLPRTQTQTLAMYRARTVLPKGRRGATFTLPIVVR